MPVRGDMRSAQPLPPWRSVLWPPNIRL
jgi:alkane 1-monooxygenase